MLDDWDDVSDLRGPLGGAGGEWLCHVCGEDGEAADLARGRCPHCGSEVERG